MEISIDLLSQSKLIQMYVKLLSTKMHVDEERKLVSTKQVKISQSQFDKINFVC